ncbi:MAG: hypothetical protein HY812_12525 [Planctomycetes bacterium]|nr:hypothetical protein [Planctomycetota bacterium]
MRLYLWISVLLLLVFGIGWTSRLLAERAGTALDGPRSEPRRPGPERFDRHGPPGGGPFLETVEGFAEELALTQEQLAALDRIMQETTDAVRAQEREIWEIMHRTRPQVLAVLTEAQRQLLEELIDARLAERREQWLDARAEWLQSQVSLDEGTLAAVRGILADYERKKGAFFDDLCQQEAFPEGLDVEAKLDELRRERDEALGLHLEADVIERLRERRGGHRR